MKINKTYRSLLDKSVESMLSAIEIYNKPNFLYREETFSILAINAWELLLKASILKKNKYNMRSIYSLRPAINKDGSKHKTKKVVDTNRCGNPKTISIYETIAILEKDKMLTSNLKQSIETLIELRDNSIHFTNLSSITNQIQELGFACVNNYINAIHKWDVEINLSEYNFYLMPLAYIDAKKDIDAVLTDETSNYVNLIKEKLATKDNTDEDFDIAITIDINFKKGDSFDAIGVSYSPDGVTVSLSEEDVRKKYPFTHKDLVNRCKSRYSDFKQNKEFNTLMKELKKDPKIHHSRKLDPENPKSSVKPFYSSNIIKKFDEKYTKK